MCEGWRIQLEAAATSDLIELPSPTTRLAILRHPRDSALVLGSTEPNDHVDPIALRSPDVAVLRRRSGGASVFVAPGAQVWLDLFVPAGDDLFVNDVRHASLFAGELWKRALSSVLGDEADLVVHDAPIVRTRHSSLVCFAGLAPGEVTSNGKKLVGCSQRRNRAGAWFFTMAPSLFDATPYVRLLSLAESDAASLITELEQTVARIDLPLAALEDALVAELAHS